MKRGFPKILFVLLLLSLTAACWKSERSTGSSSSEPSGTSIFGLSDQTEEAGLLIREANEQLKEIKKIYKDSEDQTDELMEAMKGNDVPKVKKLAGALVIQINEGMNLGNEVVGKIEKAKNMEINDTFRNYLDLKEQALTKQLEAFEIRLSQTRFLRDEFQTENKQEIERAKTALKDMDERFKKKMEAARDLSREANKIAKESMQKTDSEQIGAPFEKSRRL